MSEGMQIDDKTVIEISLDSPPQGSNLMINETSAIAPVIIEELDENAFHSMDMDMTEFVEADALKVQEITETDAVTMEEYNTALDILTDADEQDVQLTAEEEDRLTKQFLNGELTFSEYSSRMDQGADLETVEAESARKDDPESEDTDTETRRTPQQRGRRTSMSTSGRFRRRKRTLPAVLQGLMGEANLRFARGEITLAVQMCMEIIRQVPSAPEPFHTLAMIYETDQPEKSLQFALIAAHLSPRDSDQWARLANLSLESGDTKQAITCLSKAIQANPKEVSLYDKRAHLLEQNGDKKAYLRGYAKLIHQLEPDDGENIVKYAKMLAKRHMQESNNEQALEAMENIFAKCPGFITLEEVNVMTEILITLRHFRRCLNILTKYTGIRVKYKTRDGEALGESNANREKKGENSERRKNGARQSESTNPCEVELCDMPDDVVVDLKAKLLITLIELDQIAIAETMLPKFYLRENPEVSGDLFLDVAEALMGKKLFERALVLLDPLVNSTNFSLAAVWLRHAECWVGCKDLKKAITSYEVVRKLSPQHLGARSALAKLYQLKGQYDTAIDILHQDLESDALDPEVIYQRTLLLCKVRRYDEFFRSGMLLLSRHCMTIRSRVELNALTRAAVIRQRLETLQLHRLSRGEKLAEENAPTFLNSAEPSEKNEFLLFLRMCRIACQLRRFGLMQRISFSALTSYRFKNRNNHIMFVCLVASIHNNDAYQGYNLVRHMVRVFERPSSWNLLNIIIQKAEDTRHNRFIMRLLGREDAFSFLHIMHANNCLVSGTYKYALNDYVSLMKVAPSALLALLVGVTMLQMASQKLSGKKNQLVIQAFAFFKKYMQMRGQDGRQETYYNIARAFHQIDLLPAAVHYYKLVLTTDPGELVLKNSSVLDLRQEAAYNLHLIYLTSENYIMAKMYLENYIIV